MEGNFVYGAKGLPLLMDSGSIILNGSVASVKGTAAFGVYAASKAAIRTFARTWTTDLKDRHIRSNVVSPGPSIRHWRVGNLQTQLRELCPPFRWDAWGSPMKLPRRFLAWESCRASGCESCNLIGLDYIGTDTLREFRIKFVGIL